MASKLDTSGNSYVVKSDDILASEATLKIVLNSVYETARKKTTEFRISSLYSVLFSISLTLGVALITSNFKSVFCFTEKEVTGFVLLVCVVTFFVAVIFLVKYFSGKNANWEDDRDSTVSEKIKELKPEETK